MYSDKNEEYQIELVWDACEEAGNLEWVMKWIWAKLNGFGIISRNGFELKRLYEIKTRVRIEFNLRGK